MNISNGIEQLANQVAEHVGTRLGTHDFADTPKVYPGSHENSVAPFIVSWEQGPFQWSYHYDILYDIGEQVGVHLETVNHFAVAVYPIPD